MINEMSPEHPAQSSDADDSSVVPQEYTENDTEIAKPCVTATSTEDRLSAIEEKNEETHVIDDSNEDSDDDIVAHRKRVMVTKKLIVESDDESNDIASSQSSHSNSSSPKREEALNDASFENSFASFNENQFQTDDAKPKEKKKPSSKKEKAPSRKAKELALAEIHSETQRMIRERKISLPYHQPKQRTLAEFMSRRKLAPTAALKTSSDDLAKVLKHVEEREKTAEIFYAIDSGTAVENMSTNDEVKLNETKVDSKNGSVVAIESTETTHSSSAIIEDEESYRFQLSESLDATNQETANDENIGKESQPIGSSLTDSIPVDQLMSVSQESKLPDSLEKTTEEINAQQSSSDIFSESLPVQSSEDISQSCIDEDSFSLNNVRKKIDALNLPITKFPKISGDPSESIDLDEISTKPGALGLMRRFLKHAKLKPRVKKEDTVLSIISSEMNECMEVIKIKKDTVKLSSQKEEEQKPGEKLVVLKSTLQQKIAVNREKQLAKKMEEYKLYEEEFYGALKADEESDHLLSEDDEEIECDKKKYDRVNNDLISEEAAENEEDDNEEDDDFEENADDETELNEEADSQNDDGSDKDSSENSDNEELFLSKEEDYAPTSPSYRPTALQSLVGTQDAGSTGESQLMALCSGTFSSHGIDLKKLETPTEQDEEFSQGTKEHNESSDESDDDSVDKNDKNEQDESDEELIPVRKSGVRKLSFSDNEDTVDEPVPEVRGDDGGSDDHENDEVEGENESEEDLEDTVAKLDEFDDDDEEDEEMQLAKKFTKGFLEREAELSGSEWGSDDEEEKGMDEYEKEEGDDERINQRRVQKELGKIHAREMMVEDSREIKILQELLLEDGELHSDGPKRQRLYRWANQGDDNFGENPFQRNEDDVDANDDEEDEESWRKERLERENYLRKKKIDNLELEDPDCTVSLPSNTNKKLPKIQPQTCSTASTETKPSFKISMKRGSFLNRGEKMLSKLAEITNYTGSGDKATTNSRNNRNMVFSVISPTKDKPEEEAIGTLPTKRKMNAAVASVAKRIKTDKCDSSIKLSVLEQLKALEST